jgi:general secretion pathway protein N
MTRHRRTPRRIILIAGLVAALGAEALAATAPFAAAPRDPPSAPPRETQLEAPRPAAPVMPAAPAPAERPPEGNPLWAVPLSRLSATRERPLFAPTRRAPPPAVAAAPPPAAPPPPPAPPKPAEPDRPQLSLVGTVSGEDEGIAVVVDAATKAVLRLKTGESHKGWTLRAVLRREARFEKGREAAVLSLPAPTAKAEGAAPPANPFGSPPPGNPFGAPPPAPPRR